MSDTAWALNVMEQIMASRNISSDRYGIAPNPQSEGAHVELKLVLYRSAWQLNGEPMTSAGEVIANIGIVMEEMERQLARQQKV